MPDSPENNFATMNSLIKTTGASGSLTEGNLKITKSGLTYSYFQSSFGVTKENGMLKLDVMLKLMVLL